MEPTPSHQKQPPAAQHPPIDSVDEVVAYSHGYAWTRKRASQLFLAGNIIRLVSVLLLIAHAISVVDKQAKSDITPTLLGFACLQWADILSRYPLSVKEYEQRRGVIGFAVCYVILTALYTTAMSNKGMGLAVFLVLSVLTYIIIRYTVPAKHPK